MKRKVLLQTRVRKGILRRNNERYVSKCRVQVAGEASQLDKDEGEAEKERYVGGTCKCNCQKKK